MLRLITQTGAAVIATALLVSPWGALAANTTDIVLTWQAQSLVPPTYMGRVLPTTGSAVLVSAQLLENKAIVTDPEGVFRWYVNDFLLREGAGLTTIQFTGEDVPSVDGAYAVELVVRGHGEETLRSKLLVPRVSPRLVLSTGLPGNTLNLAGTIITALPYFFNVRSLDELSFSWTVGGVRQQTAVNRTLVSGSNEFAGTELVVSATATGPRISDSATATMSAFSR